MSDSALEVLRRLRAEAPGLVSGSALADGLGITRAAVWKAVETLRAEGHGIEAAPREGYRWLSAPEAITRRDLQLRLEGSGFGPVPELLESCGSTNDLALQRALAGAPHGTALLTENQTSGRGRRGRSWLAPPGRTLALSVLLRPELPPSRAPELTLVAAVAVAEALAAFDAPVGIKWPNDLELGGKKACGILTELQAEPERVNAVVVGIGVNVMLERSDLPPELQETATSLRESLGRPIDRTAFAATLLQRLAHWVELHAREGFEPVRAAWKARSSTLGHLVRVKTGNELIEGKAVDIDADGALLLEVGGARRRVIAGDVERLRKA